MCLLGIQFRQKPDLQEIPDLGTSELLSPTITAFSFAEYENFNVKKCSHLWVDPPPRYLSDISLCYTQIIMLYYTYIWMYNIQLTY